jgi:Gas vesicle synthesis protein GvpL/GvpF
MTATIPATSLYVYGVIPAAKADAWPGATGIGGESADVRVIKHGDLAALVSPLPPDRTPGRREDLDAHRRVLSTAIEHGTTVPMRFGVVMDGEDVVRKRLLDRHRAELQELVHTLDGREQMNVRAFYAEDALLRAVLADDPELAIRSAALEGISEDESRDERIALGEQVAKAVDDRRARDEEALLDALRRHAVDVRVDPSGSERLALNAQLLVEHEHRHQLDETVRQLGAALAGYLAIRYIGPLPPYSFAALSLEPEDG